LFLAQTKTSFLKGFFFINLANCELLKMQKLKLRFFSSMLGISKIVILLLIIITVVTTTGISYYATKQVGSSSPSPTPTNSSEPKFTPTPNSTLTSAPLQTSTPNSPTTTPAASANPTPTPTPIPTPIPTISTNPTPAPSPFQLLTQEKIRDGVIGFIRLNHTETAQFMNELVWTGGRATPQGILGAETYIYVSQGWNVTIKNPVIPHPIYTITADYSAL
jgi:cytoskeletal protein RodZ